MQVQLRHAIIGTLGVYILGGEGMMPGKNEKWGSEKQNEKEGKREKEKEEKEKGKVIFLLIYGTLLLIIVY